MHGCKKAASKLSHLFKVFVAQLDGEEQLARAVEVAQDPAGQYVGFIRDDHLTENLHSRQTVGASLRFDHKLC